MPTININITIDKDEQLHNPELLNAIYKLFNSLPTSKVIKSVTNDEDMNGPCNVDDFKYKPNESIATKIQMVLKKAKRPMSAREIADKIGWYSAAATVSQLSNNGKLIKIVNKNPKLRAYYVFALPEYNKKGN